MKKICLTCDREVSTVAGSRWCCVHCFRNGTHSRHCDKRNERMMEKIKDVHTEHCCKTHGCKYADVNCTVVSGQKEQSLPCEICDVYITDWEYAREDAIERLLAEGYVVIRPEDVKTEG